MGETSTIIRLRTSNNKSIRDNNKGLPVARHFNKPDHSISDLEFVRLKGDFTNSTNRLIEEQTIIRKLKTDTHGLNKDLDLLTPYNYRSHQGSKHWISSSTPSSFKSRCKKEETKCASIHRCFTLCTISEGQ